ncbi:MAG: hypothetical protein ACYTGC_13710 [Planctomycetota bacterium]|jgi:hypothetical protein
MNFDRSLATRRPRVAFLAAAVLLATGPTLAQETKPAVALPTAQTILANYVKAIGGENAIRKPKSLTIEATMDVPAQGMSADLTIYAAAPSMYLVATNIEGLGELKQGFDGKVGWLLNPMMGPMLLEGDMLDQMRREADFYGDLHYDKHYKTMEVVEKTDFNGRPCYKMRLVSNSDSESFEIFDAESHLKVGEVSTAETPMGSIETTTYVSEYKDFGNLKLPTKLTVKQMGIDQMLTIKEVKFDTVDSEIFALPAEIKTLVAEQPTDQPGS